MKEDEGVNVWIVKERRVRIDDLESSDTANPEITFRRSAQPCGVVNSDQFFKAKLRSDYQRAAFTASNIEEAELPRIDSRTLDSHPTNFWRARFITNAARKIVALRVGPPMNASGFRSVFHIKRIMAHSPGQSASWYLEGAVPNAEQYIFQQHGESLLILSCPALLAEEKKSLQRNL